MRHLGPLRDHSDLRSVAYGERDVVLRDNIDPRMLESGFARYIARVHLLAPFVPRLCSQSLRTPAIAKDC